MLSRLRTVARQLKTETYALYLAYRDPRTPLIARIVTACVVAYAFSPIDLIPDFIPVLGYLDDLILVPLGIWLALRLIPPEVMRDARQQAQNRPANKPVNYVAGVIIVLLWVLGIALFIAVIWRFI